MNKSITLCDRCDIAMSCLLNYDGTLCRKNRTVEPTNADRVRAMSDEELAHILRMTAKGGVIGHRSEAEWLDWLRQEGGCGRCDHCRIPHTGTCRYGEAGE